VSHALVSCLFYLRIIFLIDVHGRVLHSGLEVQGSTKSLELIKKHDKVVMQCLPIQKADTIYWVKTQTVMLAKANVATIHIANYEIWHKQLGHMSPKALSKMPTGTQKFPWVQTPKFIPVCPGHAQGKMKSRLFPESQSCAMRLFELIHLDFILPWAWPGQTGMNFGV